MKKKIIILSILFVVFLIALAPVSLIQSPLKNIRAVKITGMSGSIWSGNISEISAKKINLSNIAYSISFTQLFLAKLSTDLSINSGDIQGDLTLNIGTNYKDSITVENANLLLPAEKIKDYVSTFGAKLSGDITTSQLSLITNKNNIDFIEGIARWKQAYVEVLGQSFELGEFAIELKTDESSKVINGKLLNTKNLLGLQGNLKYMPDGTLEFVGSVSESIDNNLLVAASLYKNGNSANGRMPIKFKQKIRR